jgi:ABC-type branched-subunit amino acid transport system ATPase component
MTSCDTVSVLQRGATITAGKPIEVRNDPAVLEVYLGG